MLIAQNQQREAADDLVYMVTGTDELGDSHTFVTSNRQRAEARHAAMLDSFTEVRANWLEEWG